MIGYVDGYGQYHPGKSGSGLSPDSSQYKAWSHDRQRAEHQADLLQAYDRNGRPNAAFIEQYPRESEVNGMKWEDRSE